MDQAGPVQEADAVGDAADPGDRLVDRDAVRVRLQRLGERRRGDVLHHDPVVAVGVGPHVEQRHQVRMRQVQALPHAAELDVEVVLQQLQRDLAAAVGRRLVHLAERPAVDRPADRESVERRGGRGEGEFHGADARGRGKGSGSGSDSRGLDPQADRRCLDQRWDRDLVHRVRIERRGDELPKKHLAVCSILRGAAGDKQRNRL